MGGFLSRVNQDVDDNNSYNDDIMAMTMAIMTMMITMTNVDDRMGGFLSRVNQAGAATLICPHSEQWRDTKPTILMMTSMMMIDDDLDDDDDGIHIQ